MNYISIKHLKALRACEDQTQKFRETFGNSVKFDSLEEAQELALKYAQEFDFNWIGGNVFREAYREAVDPLRKAYEEAEAPLWKAYQEAKAPIWKAYQEDKAPIWKAYQEDKAPIWGAYEEAEAPLWGAYEEARAPLWKDYQEGRAKLFAKMWWELPKDFQVK